jgi:CheY-like chemotaxis protein
MAPHNAGRVLVIDDDASVAKALRGLLSRDGYRVETAANGQQALTLIRVHLFEVILCDLRMPDLDGRSFYGRLLLEYPAQALRVIFLTGDTLSQASLAFLERSGQPWLPKPCTATTVRRTVRSLCVRARWLTNDHGLGRSCCHTLCAVCAPMSIVRPPAAPEARWGSVYASQVSPDERGMALSALGWRWSLGWRGVAGDYWTEYLY